jgi:hypothetical protein
VAGALADAAVSDCLLVGLDAFLIDVNRAEFLDMFERAIAKNANGKNREFGTPGQ